VPKKNIIAEKSFSFALEIVSFCKILHAQRNYVLSDQLLRSGTSIGANVEGATQAQSRKDFIAKLCIANKEAHETRYWLRLLEKGEMAKSDDINLLLKKCEEIIKILVSILKTTRSS
jgi:four helix bundle protein